ncbi:MAG: hypothetical protein IJS93_00690 [Clostridia bacterium]|nr:hypothetical protein [Clostridia bacterium]
MEEKIDTLLLNGYQGAIRGAYEAGAKFIGAVKTLPPVYGVEVSCVTDLNAGKAASQEAERESSGGVKSTGVTENHCEKASYQESNGEDGGGVQATGEDVDVDVSTCQANDESATAKEGLSLTDVFSSSDSVLSAAFGAAVGGKRAFALIDSLPTSQLACYSLTGVNGALVILFVEDAFIRWDSRAIFKSAHFPVLEPSDSLEIKRFVKIAFNMSEKYDVPVVVRASKILMDSLSSVDVYPQKIIKDRAYKKDASKYSLLPSTVALCEDDVVERDRRLSKDAETFPIHQLIERGSNIGVIAAGEEADIAINSLPEASVLKLGSSNPLPLLKIEEFSKTVKKLYVLEERPFIELALIKMDIKCFGASLFPREGRKSAADVEGWIGKKDFTTDKGLAVRSPDFCNDCSLVPLFIALKAAKIPVFTDLSCPSLSAGFLSVGEVAVDNPLLTAVYFSAPSVAVLFDYELLKHAEGLQKIPSSQVELIIIKTNFSTNISSLLSAFGISATEKTLAELEKRNYGGASILKADGCKYEK